MANRTVSVALKAEIGQYVAGMNKAAAATMSVGESAMKQSAQSKAGFDIAGKGALLMGGAVVAGLGMAVARSMEFEKSMSAVQAATGATGAELDSLRAAAMKAGADTAYSATEAADGITEMAKAGVSAKDIVGGGLSGALSLAAAGQIDVADAAGIASTAMTQFGLSGKDIPHVADLLAAGAGKAMGSVGDLGQALNQAGLIASAAGLNIEETTGGLAAFASAGLVGSDAGTSFKTMLQALQAPSGKAAQLMSDLGLNMYDANGNMLGLADMAGQLQEHLGGLTQEQRNSALATIFGSDAVRAANVLYKEGAAGIEDWTKKVNDAGYAADQAKALQDNLAGDLEKLGGAFDTLLTSVGGQGQGALRNLTQDLTGVVGVAGDLAGVFSKIPGPVVAGTVALAAFAMLKGPVGSAMDTIALKSMYAADSIGGSAGIKGAMSNVVGAINPMMIAVAAAGVVVAGLASTMHKASSTEDEWAQAILNGSQAVNKFAQEAKAQDDKEPFAWMTRLDHWTGMTASMDDARKKARELYDAMDPLAQANQNVAYDTARLSDAIDRFGASSPQAQQAADLLAASNDRLARRQGEVKDATDTATAAYQAAQDPAAALQTSLEGIATAAGDSTKQIGLYKASLDSLTGAHITAAQAESDFYAALDASKGALDGLAGSVLNASGGLDLQSAAGRKTQDVLLGVKDSADQYIATLIQQGGTTDQVQAKDAELRDAFYQTALQMTGNADAAGRLTDELYGIPADRTTKITADTKQATDAAAAVQAQLDNMRDRVLTVRVNTISSGTTFQDSYQTAGGGRALGMAYQAMGGIVHAYAAGGFESMSAGVAQVVKPNTWRIIGDRVSDDEAYIPINSSARSQSILGQTAERMGYSLTSRETSAAPMSSREFSGGGGSGGWSSGAANVSVQARVFVGNREISDIARVEAEGVVVGALGGVTDRGRYNG